MKKVLPLAPAFLFVIYSFIPLCMFVGVLSGYSFVPYNYQSILVTEAIVSIAITIAMCLSDILLNKINTTLSALLLPLSAINGICFMSFKWNSTVIFALICCGCAVVVFCKHARSFALKLIMGILSTIPIAILLLGAFAKILFGDFVNNTVVESLASPQDTYIAEVVDNDQGALGGSTLVYIKETNGIHLLIGEFSKKSLLIYTGKWGEFEDMQIEWIDEHTLMINGAKYGINM